MKSHILYCSSGIVACPPHQAPVESYSARGLDASSGDESHDTLPVRGKLRGGVVGEYIVYADDYYKFSGEERWRDIMQLVEARGEYVKPRSKIQSRFNSGRASDFFKVAVTAEAHSPKGRGLYRLLLS